MNLLTDLIRARVIEHVDLIGTQHGAEAYLGLPRSTLSRFLRGAGVTSESLDRLAEAVGLAVIAEDIQREIGSRWTHKGNPQPPHDVDPKYMVTGSPSYWACNTCYGPVLLNGRNPPVTVPPVRQTGRQKEPDMGAQP